MFLLELFLDEMAGGDYQRVSKQAIQEYADEGIELLLTRHVADQVAYNTDRGNMVTPELFLDMMMSILRAFVDRKLGKFIYMAGKKPEAHALFKHKFTTSDGKITVINVPCAISKQKVSKLEKTTNPSSTMFKFTMITFMVKDNYQNDNFPQDSVMWV